MSIIRKGRHQGSEERSLSKEKNVPSGNSRLPICIRVYVYGCVCVCACVWARLHSHARRSCCRPCACRNLLLKNVAQVAARTVRPCPATRRKHCSPTRTSRTDARGCSGNSVCNPCQNCVACMNEKKQVWHGLAEPKSVKKTHATTNAQYHRLTETKSTNMLPRRFCRVWVGVRAPCSRDTSPHLTPVSMGKLGPDFLSSCKSSMRANFP